MGVFDWYNVESVYIWQTCRVKIQIDCQIQQNSMEAIVAPLLRWCSSWICMERVGGRIPFPMSDQRHALGFNLIICIEISYTRVLSLSVQFGIY